MELIDVNKLYIPPEEMNARMAVAYAPRVDAVPIVRCKNCKYYDEQTFMGHSMGWASCSGRFADVDDHGMRFRIPSEDWFCADGVKRDEDAAN
jgi:hypothetical protein